MSSSVPDPTESPGHGAHGQSAGAGDLRQVERALRESEARYRMLVEQSLVGIYVVQDGRFRYVNPRFAEVFGYAVCEIVERIAPEALIHEEDRAWVLASMARRLAGEIDQDTYAFRGLRRDGAGVVVEVQGRRTEVDGRPAVIGMLLDVTGRRALEARLLEAQKLEAVGQLAGGIAHDFNNVLTAIQGRADLLLEDLSDPVRARADLLEIRSAAERAAGLVRQLLAFGRRQFFQPRVVELNRLLDESRPLFRTLLREDVELRFDLGPELPRIQVDPVQVRQVVSSLVVNARDAMPEGGVLEIRTRAVEVDAAGAALHQGLRPGRYCVLAIADSGHGMPPEVRDRVFEPFFTTKPQGIGTGLGLASAWGIMGQSGGHISVESAVGEGTTFSLFFPAVPEAGEGVARGADPARRRDAVRASVLLVEDEDAVRAVARRILDRAGYDVIDVGSPVEALRLCTAGEVRPDAIVTDVVMPQLSGPAMVARLAESGVAPPVLFVSGHPAEAAPQLQSLPAHAAYLEKPFTIAALTGALGGLLEGVR